MTDLDEMLEKTKNSQPDTAGVVPNDLFDVQELPEPQKFFSTAIGDETSLQHHIYEVCGIRKIEFCIWNPYTEFQAFFKGLIPTLFKENDIKKQDLGTEISKLWINVTLECGGLWEC